MAEREKTADPSTGTPREAVEGVLREFVAEHEPTQYRGVRASSQPSRTICAACRLAWPCPSFRMAAEIARLRTELAGEQPVGQHADMNNHGMNEEVVAAMEKAAKRVREQFPSYYSNGTRTMQTGMDTFLETLAKEVYATTLERNAFLRRCGVDR